MKPSETIVLLQAMISARLPILLVGSPGVGKTDLVRQAAASCNARLVLSHPAVEDPTTPGGIPWPNAATGRADYLPCGVLADLLVANVPTVWCLDDIGQAAPATQAAYMQWILAREVNGMRLPDCVTIVACTNRRGDRAGVNGLLEPVKSRFATIVDCDADLDDWCNWALDNGIPVPVIAFLRVRSELLCSPKPTTEMVNSPNPRTWANLAKLVDLELPASVQMSAYAGAVGEGAACEFLAFQQMFAALVSADDILLDAHGSPIPTKLSELYAVATAVAHRSSAATIGRILIYADRMLSGGNGEFAVLMVRDAVRKCKSVTATGEYIRAMSGPLGKMIIGE